MKASELIGELRKLVGKHGDKEVVIDCAAIHASLSSVGVGSNSEDFETCFVMYQGAGDDGRLFQENLESAPTGKHQWS